MHGNRRSRGDPLAHLTAVDGIVTKFLRDPEKLVVLRDSIRATERTCLDLPGIRRDRDV